MWNQMKRILVSVGVTAALLISASVATPAVAAAETLSSPAVTVGQGFSGTSVASSKIAITNTASTNKGQDFVRGGYRSGSRGFSGRSYSSPSRSTFGSTSRGYGYGGTSLFGTRSGIGSHLFSFGAGYMLGSLFHPFGGYYGFGGGYGFHGFSLFGFIIDLIVLWVIWRIVRRLFFRR